MTPDPVPAGPALEGRRLVQIALTTRDMERSKRFYRDQLGLKLLFEAGPMVFYELGNLRLTIGVEPSLTPGGSVIYFDAPDMEDLAPRLEARGIVFSGPAVTLQRTGTHELKLREFKDPDGNSIALMGMVPRG